MKRSGGRAGDTVAIRDDILLSSEIWRANIVMLQGRRLTKDNIEAKNLAYKLPTQAMPKSINADMF